MTNTQELKEEIEELKEEIEELKEEIEELKEEYDNLSNNENEKEYKDFLDEIYPPYEIGQLKYYASDILKNCDEVAFNVGLNEFNDEKLSELKNTIEEKEEELKEKEEELNDLIQTP